MSGDNSNDDRRARTLLALNKFITKQTPHGKTVGELSTNAGKAKPRAKNKKPERSTEKECLAWMRLRGWDVQIYEAKATFNPHSGGYTSSTMKAGTPDCMGVDSFGNAVAVEFKARGKLSTFNENRNYRQREFILKRIAMNSFAVCVDSSDLLCRIYIEWLRLRTLSLANEARDYLLRSLPIASRLNKNNADF